MSNQVYEGSSRSILLICGAVLLLAGGACSDGQTPPAVDASTDEDSTIGDDSSITVDADDVTIEDTSDTAVDVAADATDIAGDVELDAVSDMTLDLINEEVFDVPPPPEACLEPPECPSGDVIEVANDEITADTVWSCPNLPYHLDDDVVVTDGATLTICPGVEVQFASEATLMVGTEGGAAIVSIGVDGEPISFTSDQGVGSAGDWEAVIVGPAAVDVEFIYTRFEYGGNYSPDAGAAVEANLAVIGTEATIYQCAFENSAGYGVHFIDGGSAVEFGHNTFSDNASSSIRIEPQAVGSLRGPNSFDLTDRVEVDGGTVLTDATWVDLGTPYELSDGDVYVEAPGNPTLRLAPGVSLLFGGEVALLIGANQPGSIIADASGTGTPITFGSAAAVGSAGDWEAVVVDAGATEATFRNVVFEYAGDYTPDSGTGVEAALAIIGSTATITHSTFSDSAGYGVHFMSGGQAAEFHDNTFSDNVEPSIFIQANAIGGLTAPNTFVDADDRVLVEGEVVSDNATWQNLGAPYQFNEDVLIEGTSTPVVTVSPTAELLFESDAALIVGYNWPGSLIADGTTGVIRFGSYRGVPAAGDWEGVIISEGADQAVFRNVTIEFGGDYSPDVATNLECLLAVLGTDAIIANSTFRGSEAHGIYFDDEGYADEFHDNTFVDIDDFVISIEANEAGTLAAPNTMDAGDRVEVRGGTIVDSATWLDLGAPYRITGDIRVGGVDEPVFNLADGADLYFDEVSLVIGVDGPATFNATGTFFGSAGPIGSYWEAVILGAGLISGDSTITGSTFDHCGDYSAAVSPGVEACLAVIGSGNDPNISNCTFQSGESYCILRRDGANPTLTGNSYGCADGEVTTD